MLEIKYVGLNVSEAVRMCHDQLNCSQLMFCCKYDGKLFHTKASVAKRVVCVWNDACPLEADWEWMAIIVNVQVVWAQW